MMGKRSNAVLACIQRRAHPLSGHRWSLKSGQVAKLLPSMRRMGYDEQNHTQALHG